MIQYELFFDCKLLFFKYLLYYQYKVLVLSFKTVTRKIIKNEDCNLK